MFAPVPISPHPPFSTAATTPSAPTANFTGTPTSGTAPLSVVFTDTSTGSPTSWAWDFGDGNTSTSQNPTNNYVAAGTYTVKLTATNASGSNVKTRTNYITATSPVNPPTPGRSGLGGDDVPYRSKSPHRGWDKKEWEARVKEPDNAVEKTLREAYAELTGKEQPFSVLAQVDAIVRPASRQVARDLPLRIDWRKLSRDYDRAQAMVRLWQEERELQAAMDDDDETMMLL